MLPLFRNIRNRLFFRGVLLLTLIIVRFAIKITPETTNAFKNPYNQPNYHTVNLRHFKLQNTSYYLTGTVEFNPIFNLKHHKILFLFFFITKDTIILDFSFISYILVQIIYHHHRSFLNIEKGLPGTIKLQPYNY